MNFQLQQKLFGSFLVLGAGEWEKEKKQRNWSFLHYTTCKQMCPTFQVPINNMSSVLIEFETFRGG